MTRSEPVEPNVALSHLQPEEKAARASSFGGVASHYDRYRPGPPAAAVDWLLPSHPARVVDLGAGTGALSRMLVDRCEEVVAVEPDARMRAVLGAEVPGVQVVDGRGESIPLPDGCMDGVLASSSWHWVDAVPALHEVGRVLVPGGVLGAVWSGPDPEGAFLVQAQTLLSGPGPGEPDDAGAGRGSALKGIMGDARRPASILEIPPGVPFDQPEHEVFQWEMALTADDLIGLLGTFSWIITLPEESRQDVYGEARRLLRDMLGVVGEVTVDVEFRAEAWRAARHR